MKKLTELYWLLWTRWQLLRREWRLPLDATYFVHFDDEYATFYATTHRWEDRDPLDTAEDLLITRWLPAECGHATQAEAEACVKFRDDLLDRNHRARRYPPQGWALVPVHWFQPLPCINTRPLGYLVDTRV